MKRQREQAKKEKAAAKAEKRLQRNKGEKSGGPEIIPDDDLYVPPPNED